jgi:hypothetical protein
MPAPKPAVLLLSVTLIISACGDGGGHGTLAAGTYAIGGGLTGLGAGKSVVLQDNGGDDLTLRGDGNFTFAAGLNDGAAYAVTVLTPPGGQHCDVARGTGTVRGADVIDITVSCSIDPPAAPALSLSYGVKQLKFSWNAVADTDYYKLLENPDGVSGYTQVGADLTTTGYDHDIPLYRRLNATYLVEACNSAGCTDSVAISPSANLVAAVGYIKASNTDAADGFGGALALSADGNTLVVGADGEDSKAPGIGGDQGDNSASAAGAVYVFTRDGGVWSQQAYIKASNAGSGDEFGYALALSADGSILAVGAAGEASNATGFYGDQSNNSAGGAGAVYVFTRSGGVWSQQAYVKASNTGAGDNFGAALALAPDGNTMAVGAPGEDSNATGIDGDQSNDSAGQAGAVYVFTSSGGIWSQQAYIKASNTDAVDFFGRTLALAAEGTTLAVGAYGEDSNATGIGGDQSDNSASNAGAVYLFIRSGGVWSQQAYVKASNTDLHDAFGTALALAADGNTLAVGAIYEASDATGIDGDQTNNLSSDAGAVYVFIRGGGAWSQQAYLKASNTGVVDYFGDAFAMAADGNTLAVGADGEHSNATGIGGDQSNNSAGQAGAVYVFTRSSGVWSQQAYVKASNTDANDAFGSALGLTADGDTLAVGAPGEAGNATGLGGNQSDDSATGAGAAYLY